MSILSLLFVLMFLLLLALDYKRLSRFLVLVIDHITLIHVVDLFLVVGINYCVTELLLFPSLLATQRRRPRSAHRRRRDFWGWGRAAVGVRRRRRRVDWFFSPY
jgi:hypothetical protein